MTDYFALLQQPRRPWLEPAELKQCYHDLARRTQIDHQTNRAYRILLDPKSRLEHLLALEAPAPERSAQQVPPELADLFMQIAPLLNPGSGVKNPAHLEQMITRVETLREQALGELVQTDQLWMAKRAEAIPLARMLYHRLSYLSRWRDLLREHQFTLSA